MMSHKYMGNIQPVLLYDVLREGKGLKQGWSFIWVTFAFSGLSLEWSFPKLMFPRSGLSLGWSFLGVVFLKSGLSLQGLSLNWTIIRGFNVIDVMNSDNLCIVEPASTSFDLV